jgi:AcrR family transcriptional regulator
MTHPISGTPSPEKRTRDPKGTRERLVRAALELFTTEGYHSSTTPLIAARAGIAEGTIYRHFQSKEQLLNEIYRAAVRMLAATVTESATTHTCRERLDRIASIWQGIAKANPPLIRLVFATDTEGLLDSRSKTAFANMVEELEMVMAAGKSVGQVKIGSARIWADVWLRLVVLVLERTANGEWPADHPAPRQVFASAWAAICSPGESATTDRYNAPEDNRAR